jgi:hypothetical protein
MLTPLEPIDRLADLIQPQRGQAAEPREAAVRLSEAEWLLWVESDHNRVASRILGPREEALGFWTDRLTQICSVASASVEQL